MSNENNNQLYDDNHENITKKCPDCAEKIKLEAFQELFERFTEQFENLKLIRAIDY